MWYAADSAHIPGQLAAIAYSDTTPDYAVSYGYDAFGRFSTVSVTNGPTFAYSYLPSTALLTGYTNDLGLSVAYAYEPLRDHKTLVSNAWSTNTISTFAYTYDAIGRRTQRIDDSTTTNLFGYNPCSELVSAEMGTNTYAYAYDPLGNRTSTTENNITNLYAANELNQYTALNPASSDPTTFTYDLDGNMTSDGKWCYTWDAENRLIEVQPFVTNLDSSLVQFIYDSQSRRIARREFAWMAYLHDAPDWRYVQGRAYRYDDWNLLQELQPAYVPRTPPGYIFQTDLDLTGIGGLAAAQYVWGLDLSSTLQGAGGVGGLLQASRGGTNAFSFYDANGNTTAMTGDTGTIMNIYAYDAFGSEISLQCSDLGIHPFHFSTKSQEKGIGLSYYGYRFYKLDFGRWMNRDPIGERGEFHWAFRQDDVSRGLSTLSGNNVASWMKEEYEDTKNPYHFVWNNPVTKWDYLGLKSGFFRRGRCCNISSHDEWALVAVGTNCPAWRKLAPGQCVGGKIGNLDCEGMTCGGGFYMVSGRLLGGGHCVTPGYDHGPFKKLRWTPTQKDCDAKAPSHRTHCKGLSDTPPDYKYTPRPCASRM